MQLILASSSPYRKQLLAKFGLEFSCISPEIDESAKAGETPQQLVLRLSVEKAKKIAESQPDALIIGSDQVAVLDHTVMGKPRDHAHAVEQLTACSGKHVHLYTGLCLLNSATGKIQSHVEPFSVHYKTLSQEQIEAYLRKDQPYNCGGSLKSESLGIALLSSLAGADPNALIGLPLIALCNQLALEGIDVITA